MPFGIKFRDEQKLKKINVRLNQKNQKENKVCKLNATFLNNKTYLYKRLKKRGEFRKL